MFIIRIEEEIIEEPAEEVDTGKSIEEIEMEKFDKELEEEIGE